MPFFDSVAPLPTGLQTDEFVLRPIRVSDVERDYAAVMDTRDDLRRWEQDSWPADDFTVEQNRVDLDDLERRHDARRAFTYTVLDPGGDECLGCVYIFPTTATFLTKATVTPVRDDSWEDVDAVVYFWVRTSRTAAAMDRRLLEALREWFADEWAFQRPVYAASELFEEQVRLFSDAGMPVRFELREPHKPARYFLFAGEFVEAPLVVPRVGE